MQDLVSISEIGIKIAYVSTSNAFYAELGISSHVTFPPHVRYHEQLNTITSIASHNSIMGLQNTHSRKASK